MDNWRDYLLPFTATLEDVVTILEQNQCAVIVDGNNRLAGTLTDRDVRSALLKHISLQSPVSQSMNTDPTYLSKPLDISQARDVHHKTGYEQYPIVDDERVVCGIFTAKEILSTKLPNAVILMAGGIGSRLSPLTNNCPKPLLQIGEKPILETILIELLKSGFQRFWISVNYRGDMIEEYFGDGSLWNVQIQYLREEEPLGTAGSLKLLPEIFNEPVIVMNGDLLTKLNYQKLLAFHEYHKAQITVGVREYDLRIPYGVIELEDLFVVDIKEKPIQSFFVNAGIYVLEPHILKMIPDSHFNMTELLSKMMTGKKVVAFPVHEYWIDIGQYDDFKKAKSDYESIFQTNILKD